MISSLRIGVPIIGEQGWLGGITYVELLIKALGLLSEQERPKIFLVVPESKLGALDLHSHIFSMLDGFIFLGNNYRLASSLIQHPFIHCRSYSELADHIDFYYPVNSDVVPELCSGSWIPDFQHVHLPDFFPKEELVRRDGWFRKVAEKAKLAVFSSKDSEDDFRRLYPDSPAATRVLHFYALPVDDWYQADPAEVQSKYNLPDNFLICCNQFWVHKNHARLFEAFAIVRRTAPDMHLVCTGAVSEWRVRDYFDNLMKLIDRLDIKDCVHILGTIPRNDQIQLIRRSLAVIQPSLFEGWSTVIEDSRALGKSMVLSDLKVHYEQAPDHAVYFDRNSPDDLAGKISSLLPELKPGPDASREREARAKARESVLTYAREFCGIALEAQRLCGRAISILGNRIIGTDVPSSGKKITIATSIAPKNIGRQQEAVQSWLKLGFDVASLNCREEVSELRDQFPEVTFVEVDRDARAEIGKPMVYFDSFREFFRRSDSRICGIVNSDVLLEAADGLMSFIEREAENCMVTGCRVDVQEPQSREGTLYLYGFDYFFFDRSMIELYPEDKFTLGSPWWDYWILLIPITKGVRVKNVVPPIGYHVRHTVNWKHEIWTAFGERIAVYIRDQNTGIAPDPDLDPSLKYYGISHAVETHILQNSEYIAFKPAASRLLDFFLLDKIDLSSQIAAVRGPLSKFKLRTFEIYLKKCFELFPGYLNIYLTMLELLFESNSFDAVNDLISKIRQIVANRPDEFNRRQTHSSNKTGPGSLKKKHPLMDARREKSSTLPKVSAIVSTYNSSRFMRGCLEDLVNQTLYEKGRLEIVVVDSGSEQNEKSIVGEFQRNYKNIQYIRTEEREFVYAAWNRGIKAASGEYITNANTDDRHRKDALEVMAGVLDQNPDVGLIYADAIITETENETFERHTQAGYFRWMDYDRVSLTLGCFIGPQPMWRKSLHEKYGYFDETFSTSGDWEFWLRIAKDTKLLHVSEGLGLYLRSTGSLERRNVSRRLEEDRTVYRRYVPEYLPDYEEYFGRLLENDPPNRLDVYRYGQILAAFRRFDEAVSIYNSYLQKNPGDKEFIPILNDIRSQTSPSQIPADVAQPRMVRSGVQKRDIRVSAIVSAYNSEKFIRGCLEDLVNQTLYQKGELEIIVVNSGSQQNEEDVVKEFQSAYSDIYYIKTEYRETIYTAWNRGIKEAKGMYITNANTDDRRRRDALEIMAGLLDENPSVALVYGDLIITKRENETFEQCSPAAYFQLPDFDRKILLHRQCIGPQPMWRRSLHDEFGYFKGDLEIAGDYEWWLRISEKYQLKHIPELLGLYLWNDAGLEHSGKELCQKESAGIRKFYMERAGMKPAFECYSSDFVVKHYQPPRSSSPSAPLPEKVMALINQADAHIANNDLTSARKAIKQAMRHASGHAQLCAMLSNILANLGDPESAGRFTEESEKK